MTWVLTNNVGISLDCILQIVFSTIAMFTSYEFIELVGFVAINFVAMNSSYVFTQYNA